MKKHFCAALVLILTASGCATLVEKTGEALEGRAFGKKTTALYRSGTVELEQLILKNGENVLEIRDSSVPGLVLRGNLPEEDGAFEIMEADFLSSHYTGWNEFTLTLIGSASLLNTSAGAVLSFDFPAERVQISTGRIRLKSSRISGDEALRNLRNRRERIIAVVEWMAEKNELPAMENQNEFEKYWKQILFPELLSKKKRPKEYDETNAEWTDSNGIMWNKTYTELLLPEWLWELRNSGALLRDWEEALAWFYLEYQWDSFFASLDGVVLKKIKGD